MKTKQIEDINILLSVNGLNIDNLHNKNQFVITVKQYTIFKSYNSLIGIYNFETQELMLTEYWNYSKTTSKHLYIWLTEECNLYKYPDKKSIEKAIKKELITIIK